MSDSEAWLDPVAVDCAAKLLGVEPYGPDSEHACLVQNPHYARACEQKYGGSSTWRRACQAALAGVRGRNIFETPVAPESRPVAALIQGWLWGSPDPA